VRNRADTGLGVGQSSGGSGEDVVSRPKLDSSSSSVGITNHAGVWNISCEMPWEVYAVGKYRLGGARRKWNE